MKTGVIIARFQSPYLHTGHKGLIEQVLKEHQKTIIVLGVSPVIGSIRNPFDYYTRERMLKKEYNNIVVLPLKDEPSDIQWSVNLDRLLTQTFPGEHFMLYGSRDSFIPYYSGKIKTCELQEVGNFNATELRKNCATQVRESEDFRSGITYAYYQQYPKVYPTVDVAVFRNQRTELLLGKKASEGKWRLVGGFTDPEDNSYEHAAKRELIEECGQITVSELHYETSVKINDWRYEKERDKIITTLFSCDYLSGTVSPQDDIDVLRWIPMDELTRLMEVGETSHEHTILFQFLLRTYYTECLTENI